MILLILCLVTWDYALLYWCTHCSNSGTLDSKSELAKGLKRLDLYSCYTIVLCKTHQGKAPSEVLETIQKKLAKRMDWKHELKDIILWLVIFFCIFSNTLWLTTTFRRNKWEKDAVPSPSTISEARDFISSLGGSVIFYNRLKAMHNLKTWLMVDLDFFPPLVIRAYYSVFSVTTKAFFTTVERT